MRRLRFTVLAVAATAAVAACAFVLWSGLGMQAVAPAARNLVVTVASEPNGPAPEASVSPTPTARVPLSGGAITSLGNQPSRPLIKHTVKPVQTGSVIIRFNNDHAQTLAFVASKGGRVIQGSNGRVVASLPTPPGTTPSQYQASLSKRSDVLYATADEIGRLQPAAYTPPTDEFVTSTMDDHWWLDAVKAQLAWQTGFGSVTTPLRGSAAAFKVGVIDTGIYMKHPDMANAQVGKDEFQSYNMDTNAYTKDNDITPYANDPYQEQWHGTATAGAVGAAVNADRAGTVGVGYNVIPVGYKIAGPMTRRGVVIGYGMTLEAAASAIYDATNAGCKVINMSFVATGSPDPAMLDAENYAHSRGVLMVAAAGNDDTNIPYYPADDLNVLSVSAVATANVADTLFTRASFSNFGTHVALAAPGQGMLLPTAVDAQYAYWDMLDGTSFSAPTVAGAVAFLWRAAPSLTADQITSLMENTAVDLGTPGRDDYFGHGMVDVNAAYNALIAQYPPLSAPTTLTAESSDGSHAATATWSPVSGTSVSYSVTLDGAAAGTTSATTLAIADLASGQHTITVQPISGYNWWNSSSAISTSIFIATTQPIAPTVSLSASARVTYPATSVSLAGITTARSSQVTVQSSTDGHTWVSAGRGWTNGVVPVKTLVSAPITRSGYFRLVVTGAPGWTNAVSNGVYVQYAAALKTPSAPSTVRHSSRFTASETISAPVRISVSSVTFTFYRQLNAGSRTWVVKRSVRATSSTTSGNATTYRVILSLPKTGSYRIYASFSGGGRYISTTSAARALRVN